MAIDSLLAVIVALPLCLEVHDGAELTLIRQRNVNERRDTGEIKHSSVRMLAHGDATLRPLTIPVLVPWLVFFDLRTNKHQSRAITCAILPVKPLRARPKCV
jgi:hypothetical protein